LEIPADLLAGEAGDAVPSRVPRERPGADPEAVRRAAAALLGARRPLLLAGAGVLHCGAWEALGGVASALGAPVITTVQGKGALADDHPWSLADMNSPAGRAAYPLADRVFAVGCRFAQTDIRWPWFTAPPGLIHLEADPAEVGRAYPTEVGLAGDVASVLQQMLPHLRAGAPAATWRDTLPTLRAEDKGQRHPVLAALEKAVGADVIAAFDVCVPGYHSRWDWPARTPRSYLYPGVYVGMGYGFPAALGAQLAQPERPVIAVCGDGGFQMTMAELGTAAQEGIPVVAVVVNDEGLTLIRRVQDQQFGGRRFAVDLKNPSFAAMARCYGIEATIVEEPGALTAAVRDAVARRRPALIEVIGTWER
jgi:acetolactate synthase-1/2/3 large subunit